jgi:hypothetical protein
MTFRITGLSPEPFRHLYGLPAAELARLGVVRYIADTKLGFPDRVEMRDADPGQTVLLLNHFYQPAQTPYHASHAIFVREGAEHAYDRVDEIPEVMRARILSLRAFNSDGMMVDADLVEGEEIETLIKRFLADPRVDYIHVHNAKRGCYSGCVDRS